MARTRSQRRAAARQRRAQEALTVGTFRAAPAWMADNPNRGKRHAAPAGTYYRDPAAQVRAAADRVGNLRIVSPLLDTGGKRRGRSTLSMPGSWDPPAADVAPTVEPRPDAMRPNVPHESTLTPADAKRIARRAATDRAVAQWKRSGGRGL